MHAISGIIIQRALHTSNELQQSSASTSKRIKNNFFRPIYNELAPYLKSKTKNNPQTINDIEQNTNNLISNTAKNQDKVLHYYVVLLCCIISCVLLCSCVNERILNVTEATFQKNFWRAVPDSKEWLNIVKDNEEYCNAPGILGESLQTEYPLFVMIENMLC